MIVGQITIGAIYSSELNVAVIDYEGYIAQDSDVNVFDTNVEVGVVGNGVQDVNVTVTIGTVRYNFNMTFEG